MRSETRPKSPAASHAPDGARGARSETGKRPNMDEETRARFEAAVERKKDESRERSHQPGPPQGGDGDHITGDQDSLTSDGRKTQDVFSVRDKNSGKGKKTADKWN